MAKSDSTRTDEIRAVLINAIEVELAALKAGIGFWREWIEHTSGYLATAKLSLDKVRSEQAGTDAALLELLDAGRESMRAMTKLPGNAAGKFIDELDALLNQRQAGAMKASFQQQAKSRKAAGRSRVAPQRRARVKP